MEKLNEKRHILPNFESENKSKKEKIWQRAKAKPSV